MNYSPRLPLKAHQNAALEAAKNKPPLPCSTDAFAYLMDMGTGKSATVLAEFGEMASNGGPKDLLLIAPKSSIRNWYADKGDDEGMWSEIRKHCPEDFQDQLIHHTWVGDGVAWSDKMARLMAAGRYHKERPRALFVNVEALSNSRNDDALDLCRRFVEQRNAMVVVDESTTIKGNSARTDAVISIGEEAKVKRILSGLWTPNSPLDLYYQCAFLDPRILGYRNFYVFQRRYATVLMQMNYGTGRKYPQVTGYINQDELRDKVARYSYRVLKKDCLDLEPKTYTSRDVELTAEQKKMLKEIRNFGFAAIGDTGKHVTTDMVIKRIIREIQIGCGYVMDDEERALHEVPENRTKALLEVLDEHVGKAIIWCPWRVPLAKIVKTLEQEYGPRCVAQFHGGNVALRGNEEKRFLNDPECRFMCATQGAGMRGNNWTVADLVVYYANNYDLEMRDQSEDRAHRIGQVNRVTYVDLIAQGTIENKVIKALRKKIDLATMINREGHKAWLI